MESEHKKILGILVMGVFLISLGSALTFKQNEPVNITIVCINAGYCTASATCNTSIFDPDNIVILDGVEATQSPSLAFYNITLNSNQTSKLGEYSVGGFCKDGSVTQLIDFNFSITTDGNELSLFDVLVRIFLILFFISLLMGTYHVVGHINFKQWNTNLIKKYENRNFIKLVLGGLLYNIMKNVFIIYYLIGLPIFLILANTTRAYNIVGLILFMDVVLFVYIIGITVVGLIFLSYVQEWIAEMWDLVKDIDWGIQ